LFLKEIHKMPKIISKMSSAFAPRSAPTYAAEDGFIGR
jgi:hypothetical protein